MRALSLAVLAAAMAGLVGAADDNEAVNIHGVVAFIRTGERTPIMSQDPSILTALGAQQMYDLGQNFRTRYIQEQNSTRGLGVQQLRGMSTDMLRNEQIAIRSLDEPYLVASAQSFMQGLYPPYTITSSGGGALGDESGILANGSAIDFPLGGYQYPDIRALSSLDPQSIYLGGADDCPAAQRQAAMYQATPEFLEARREYNSLYESLDLDWFQGDIGESQLDYMYAFEIYDYLSYAYTHNSDAHDRLTNDSSYAGVYDRLRTLADQDAWYTWGNASTSSSDQAMPGKTLAASILGQFRKIALNAGNTTNGLSAPLTLLFGEHEPFLSLASLMLLDSFNTNFRAAPPFASAMVFELFSTGNTDDGAFPQREEDLWVRFSFQNGTEFEGALIAHPMFNNGPSRTNMRWTEFQELVGQVMVSAYGDWCRQCDSPALFCWGVSSSSSSSSNGNGGSSVSPTVAGVIGAVISLAVAGLVFAAAMLLGGVRVHRVRGSKKAELGGFKGSAKLASDADVSVPKGGAAAGIVSFGAAAGGNDGGRKMGHERVGSWELRQKEFG
ncbi:phosphoglycerate mutase-like protein, partial [Corynespora cassiicola Philippines]